MKLIPPSDAEGRRVLKLQLENTLHVESGGRWRVDIILGRYGWYARAFRVARKRTGRPLPIS